MTRLPWLVNGITRSRSDSAGLHPCGWHCPPSGVSRHWPAPSTLTRERQRQLAALPANASGHRARSPRALAGHVQQLLHAGRRPCRGAVSGGGRLRGRRRPRATVSRPDLGHHRPARYGQSGPAAFPGGARAAGDDPVVVLEPSCATLLRADLPQLLPDDSRAVSLAGARHSRSRSSSTRWRSWLRDAAAAGVPGRRPPQRARPSASPIAISRPSWASTRTVASWSATGSRSAP